MDAWHIVVNGTPVSLDGAGPQTSLLDWLRGSGLTGCKEGCAEGECGSCSVLVARPAGDGSEWVAINACLPYAYAYAGAEICTAEGLGSPDALHPVQREMAERGGSQCGYCTPGFVASMAAEYYRPDRGEGGFDRHALSGNLCRCTGYRPILDAADALGMPDAADPLAQRCSQPAAEPIPLSISDRDHEFVRPATLDEALAILAERPDVLPVAGATDVGVLANLTLTRPTVVLAIDRVPELRELRVEGDHVDIGAGLTLSEIERNLAGRVPLLDLLWPQFASRLIRNAATIGGNLGTGSPIGDCAPALLALDAVVVLVSATGRRDIPLVDYYTGYRQSQRRPDELIFAVRVPTTPVSHVGFHKVAKRRIDDISSVAIACALHVEDERIIRARIGLGGVAATPVRALATEAFLQGQSWSHATVSAAADILGGEGTPMDDHRASAAYRKAMLRNSLLRFFDEHEAATS